MHLGTYMGVFWIIKFIFLPIGLTNPFLLFLFISLTLAVPFLGYFFAKSFRDKVLGGEISFMQSWVFLVFMYMFAALLTAVAHYIYFRFIDNGYLWDTFAEKIEAASQLNLPGLSPYTEQTKQGIEIMQSMSAIQMTMNFFTNNILNCSLIALITAPFVMRKKQITL